MLQNKLHVVVTRSVLPQLKRLVNGHARRALKDKGPDEQSNKNGNEFMITVTNIETFHAHLTF